MSDLTIDKILGAPLMHKHSVESLKADPADSGKGLFIDSNGGIVAQESGGTIIKSLSSTIAFDFGFSSGQEGDIATATLLTDKITNSNFLNLTTVPATSTNHESTDDHLIENISIGLSSITDGVSVSFNAIAPNNTWGEYNYNVIINYK